MARFTADPRVRQTLNQISENFESAKQRTETSLFTLSERYIQPCLTSLQPCFVSCQTCLEASCQPCCSARDDIRRHRQPRYPRRGRERAAFDFYDDWEQEEEEWGNDELDRLLAGDEVQQPGRRPGMSYGYGTRSMSIQNTGGKHVMADDPTLVPQSSIFGFLERLPWKIGGRGTRYRPSPANLRVNVGRRGQEAEPLMEEEEGGTNTQTGRPRSSTMGSRQSANSLSSRGDIFPSDDEDDAREIDEEFALALGRRSTGATTDDLSSKKRHGDSRTSVKSASSGAIKDLNKTKRSTSASSGRNSSMASPAEGVIPSLEDLKREEAEAQVAEESDVQQRRLAARRLASERGLTQPASPIEHDSKEASIVKASEVSPPSYEGQQTSGRAGASIKPAESTDTHTTAVERDSTQSKPA